MAHCNYCDKTGVRLEKLHHWDNPEKYEWYCQEHWYSVRNFQLQQKERFLNYYSNEQSRKRLSDKHQVLWETLKKQSSNNKIL